MGDETVLLELETGQYFGLNAVATRLWQLIGELGDTARVVETASQEYEVDPKRLEQDLNQLVADLLARHLLVADQERPA